MPTWGEILNELKGAMQQHGPQTFDVVRKKYITALSAHTGRNTILYATKWTQPGASDPSMIQIVLEDVQGLMEVVHGLDGSKGLDLVLHSPGGSPDAAEAIVHYLRSKFDDIRVIVPHAAMSAATMLTCASDRIVMGKHSSLGPIDPQFIVNTRTGPTALPAQAILDQFDLAKADCKNPQLLGAWAPILPVYGPSLLVQSKNALLLAEELVTEWLTRWMFANDADAKAKATAVAKQLADHTAFKSHGRPIHRERAKQMGLVVEDLEVDQVFQDLALSVYHATTHTFNGTGAVKIIENHAGRAFVKAQQQIMIPMQMGQPSPGGPQIPPGPPQ